MKLLLRLIFSTFLATLVAFFISAVVSDPYSSYTTVRSPFYTEVHENGEIELLKWSEPTFIPSSGSDDTPINTFLIHLAYARAGARITLYRHWSEAKLEGNEQDIIRQIHQKRFDPTKPYVITGAHYSDLYMRNLGIFFNAVSDPRVSLGEEDFKNRQRIVLQTLAIDLAFLKSHVHPVTTLSPLSGSSFTGLNIYEYPSDSMFSVLYALKALQSPTHFDYLHKGEVKTNAMLPAQAATNKLLDENREVLAKSIDAYLRTVLIQSTGMVRSDIAVSSARDGVKRKSSFYDNVIAWKTVQLAKQLNIPVASPMEENAWKQRIIETYWQEEKGIFKDDIDHDTFSADSFIVLSTQFLDPQNLDERVKLQRMVEYVRAHQYDQPFPLRYSETPIRDVFYRPVRFFAPSYMSDGIWSHWGMEYTKTLISLAPYDQKYLKAAGDHLQRYKLNIEQSGGYPEVYNPDGSTFSSPLLKTVLHTGWVVNYEQAKVIYEEMRMYLNEKQGLQPDIIPLP